MYSSPEAAASRQHEDGQSTGLHAWLSLRARSAAWLVDSPFKAGPSTIGSAQGELA